MPKDDLKEIFKTMTDMAIDIRSNILNKNTDKLKEIEKLQTEISQEAMTINASAIKAGFVNEKTMFCKYCREIIDQDSQFCKRCGKEQ